MIIGAIMSGFKSIPVVNRPAMLAGKVFHYNPVFKVWSLELYSKCDFRCAYCYSDAQGRSRPNSGENNILDVLEEEWELAMSSGYEPNFLSPVVISCHSDPYVPIESELELTRAAIDFLGLKKHPFGLVTRSDLVLRDLDLIKRYQQYCSVSLSVPIFDQSLADQYEPHAPAIQKRMEAIHELRSNNVPVTVRIDPWIPGVSDVVSTIEACPPDVPILISPVYLSESLSPLFQNDLPMPNEIDKSELLPDKIRHFKEHGACITATKLFPQWNQETINQLYVNERNGIDSSSNVNWLYPINLQEEGLKYLGVSLGKDELPTIL